MEPKGTLADENEEENQCPVSAHHMYDEMPSSNYSNFSGVRKRKRGEYVAEKWDPITKKRVWFGTFNTAEEASEAYLAKQREFAYAHHMLDEMRSSNSTNKTVATAADANAKTPLIKEVSFRDKSPSLGAEWHNMGRLRRKDPFKKKKVCKGFNSNMHESKKPIKDNQVESCKQTSWSMSKSSDRKRNPKDKTGLLGIRKQKNGRYGAEIRDPIKHKSVWLGTFDTIEEASQAFLSKKSEFDMLSQGNKENKPKNCDQIQPESSVGASLSMANDKTLHDAANVGRNKQNRPKNCDQIQPESSVGASLSMANDKTSHDAANVGRNKENKPKNCDQIQLESSVGASLSMANDKTSHAVANVGRNKENKLKNCDRTQPGSSVGASLSMANDKTLHDAANVGRNKENKPKNCDQIQPESSVGVSLSMANDQTLHAANVGRNKENKPKHRDQTWPESSVGASMFVANDQTLYAAANVGINKENKPKNCDQTRPESSVGASLFVANDQTLHAAANVGRTKKNDSPKTKRIVGVHKNKWGKYTSEIINPISKKKIWLGTFSTHEEASQAYRSKKLEFRKLVKPKKNCNKKTHSTSREKQVGKEKLVNVKQGHVNCEGFHADQYMKFDVQRSKEAELQSKMPVDFSTGEKKGGQEDADLWMGQWVQLPDGREVKFSLELGIPIIDNYGSLLGEFSSLDDVRRCDESIYLTEDNNE